MTLKTCRKSHSISILQEGNTEFADNPMKFHVSNCSSNPTFPQVRALPRPSDFLPWTVAFVVPTAV